MLEENGGVLGVLSGGVVGVERGVGNSVNTFVEASDEVSSKKRKKGQ
jgi:hypothetical protein